MTANSFTSVSVVPPVISVCVAEHAHLLPLLKEKRVFGINVLKQEQQHLSEFFACADQPQKDEASMNVNFIWTPPNIPLMENVLCQIACRLHAIHVAVDHTIVFAKFLSTPPFPLQPFLFFRA